MTPIDILDRVFDLLSKPGGWRQDEYAGIRMGESGSKNPPWSALADTTIYDTRGNCFCLGGAIDKVCGVHNSELGLRVREEIRKFLGIKVSISIWNDDPFRTVEEVLAAVAGTREHLLGQVSS